MSPQRQYGFWCAQERRDKEPVKEPPTPRRDPVEEPPPDPEPLERPPDDEPEAPIEEPDDPPPARVARATAAQRAVAVCARIRLPAWKAPAHHR